MELKPLLLLSVQFLESSQFTALNISGTSGMDHVWQRRGRRFSAHQTFSIIESRESNSLSLPRGEEETCYLPSVLRDRPHTGRGASSRGVPPPVPPRSPRSKALPPLPHPIPAVGSQDVLERRIPVPCTNFPKLIVLETKFHCIETSLSLCIIQYIYVMDNDRDI